MLIRNFIVNEGWLAVAGHTTWRTFPSKVAGTMLMRQPPMRSSKSMSESQTSNDVLSRSAAASMFLSGASTHDAHHLNIERAFRSRETQTLPDRIAIGPEPPRHRGAHDRDSRGIRTVGPREHSAALQRDPERREIFRRDTVLRVAHALGRSTFADQLPTTLVAAERDIGANGGRADTWKLPHPLDELFREPNPPSIGIPLEWQGEPCRNNAVGTKARVYIELTT